MLGSISFGVFLVDMEYEYTMTSGASFVHSCGGNSSVFGPALVDLLHLFGVGNVDFCDILHENAFGLVFFDLEVVLAS